MKKKGFTLIELLVVIAIVGLLATLAVVSLNDARKKANDAKRISDLKAIQTAMEMYKNNANPEAATLDISSTGLAQYVQGSFPKPVDDNLRYYICANGTSYLIAAKLQIAPTTYPIASGVITSYTTAQCVYVNSSGATGAITALADITCGTNGTTYTYCIGTK